VGKNSKLYTGVIIVNHTCVCLEMNTQTGTLDYFINDKHIEDHVVNVPKDVYFQV
jgi:Flp pilus assembly CpaF family ATPase